MEKKEKIFFLNQNLLYFQLFIYINKYFIFNQIVWINYYINKFK